MAEPHQDAPSLDDIPATLHGAQRLRERGFTYARYLETKAGEAFTQPDGATAYVRRVSRNQYDVVVEGADGVVTVLASIIRQEVHNLTANYGWK